MELSMDRSMDGWMDAWMHACMHASQAHILSISGHLVVCARTMCKQCFTESKRLVKVDNGQSVICRETTGGRPCFCLELGTHGMDRTLCAKHRIKDTNVTHRSKALDEILTEQIVASLTTKEELTASRLECGLTASKQQ
jgi:hypothetical protein